MRAFSVELNDFPQNATVGGMLSFDLHSAKVHVDPEDPDRLRRIQMAARKLAALGVPAVRLSNKFEGAAGWAFWNGFVTAKNMDGVEFENADADLRNAIECATWMRNAINATPEDLSPRELAERSWTFLSDIGGDAVQAEIKSGDELARENYVGLHGVGRGSERPPALLSLDFNPSAHADAPVDIALVGKGITFDSGGYSIKESVGMLSMKCDMGGAALVTAALGLAIKMGLKKRVRLLLCCAENLISGHAYKLGDVLRYRNGVSVEVVNTDAEGRLVLADGLIDAAASGAGLIIDAATLTGAAITALGTDYNAVFTPHAALAQRYLAIAGACNELHWQLPLAGWHRNKCPSAYADTANSRPVKGGGPGGASNAAGFLSRFVAVDTPWLHLDLAAAFMDADGPMYAAGATGSGLRTLAQALLDLKYSSSEAVAPYN
jgi:PepB aminopeptidase